MDTGVPMYPEYHAVAGDRLNLIVWLKGKGSGSLSHMDTMEIR